MKKLFVVFSFFYFSVQGQLVEGKRITKELCSEKFFGRGYVRSGDSLAAEFLAQEFNKRELKKVGNSYFQEFSFQVNTFPNEMLVLLNGATLQAGVDFMVDPSSGSSNLEWNYHFLDKTNLFDQKQSVQLIRDIREKRTWNSLVMDFTQIGGDSLKKVKKFANEMANYCPIMVLTNEKFTFSVSDDKFNYSLIYLKANVFQKEAKITTQIDAVIKARHIARNVIAYLPASKKTKKHIFLTAHYDHLGGMGNKTYFPGANDNASGTSILFAIADELKKKKLKYNVVFIAFAGEEAGLIGSKYYTENPLVPLKHTEFVLNLDIMGSGEEGITVVNATEFPDYFKQLLSINEKNKYLAKINKRGKAANSDHFWFSEKGIPAFFIYTMGPNKNYHDVFDTYENLSFNEYEDLVKLILDFLRKL